MAELPPRLITDTESKSVTVTPQVESMLPGVVQAFGEVDQAFLQNPANYLDAMQSSVSGLRTVLQGSCQPNLTQSLIYGPQSRTDEVLIMFAPFCDRNPRSSGGRIYDYTNSGDPSFIAKELASPHTWNQITKSAVTYELLKAMGKELPVVTFFSPLPTYAQTYQERKSVRQGDFTPAARFAARAIQALQGRFHGQKSETQIRKVHLAGASLGASNAVGAAKGLLDKDFEVQTVTAQELILGPQSLLDLGIRFMLRKYEGDPSAEGVKDYPQVAEPALRRALDIYGSEPVGMTLRMLKSMKPTPMFGLTRPHQTVKNIEKLLGSNVSFLAALAMNSSISAQTATFLPVERDQILGLNGQMGQKLGHEVNEHVAASSMVTAMNILRAQ